MYKNRKNGTMNLHAPIARLQYLSTLEQSYFIYLSAHTHVVILTSVISPVNICVYIPKK